MIKKINYINLHVPVYDNGIPLKSFYHYNLIYYCLCLFYNEKISLSLF